MERREHDVGKRKEKGNKQHGTENRDNEKIRNMGWGTERKRIKT